MVAARLRRLDWVWLATEAANASLPSAVAGSSPMRDPGIWPAYSNEIQVGCSTTCGIMNASKKPVTWAPRARLSCRREVVSQWRKGFDPARAPARSGAPADP